MPATLNEAIALQPAWLQAWIMVLVLTHLAALAFVVGRVDARWQVRVEPFVIIGSFLVAAVFMSWLYERVGYVRLLGLAHVLFWTPAWVWIWRRRRRVPAKSVYGWYLVAYLAIAGTSLIVDVIDLCRYVLGMP
ncbi:MAG: hypothetical protein R3E86_15670 [Pseudomonadales bacterium]